MAQAAAGALAGAARPATAVSVVRLSNVRGYATAEFRPAPGLTLVLGPNASGKSTLLEAIGLFATLSSPRTGHLGALVRHGAEEAGAHLETGAGTALEIRLRGGRALLKAGGSGTVARTFLSRFRAVLFTPEDLDLVRGEPELRRRALDELIVQLRPAYRGARQDFERALRQRNAALRQQRPADARVFNAPLAAAASQVLEARRTLVARLRPAVSSSYADVAGDGTLEIRYRESAGTEGLPAPDLEAHFLTRYENDLEVEVERGTTRAGPHRDDLDIDVNGAAARAFASRGEQRSAALALRLAELDLLPGAILLLDDVLSELDAGRRERLLAGLAGRQAVVTTTGRDALPPGLLPDASWTVRGGVLREQ